MLCDKTIFKLKAQNKSMTLTSPGLTSGSANLGSCSDSSRAPRSPAFRLADGSQCATLDLECSWEKVTWDFQSWGEWASVPRQKRNAQRRCWNVPKPPLARRTRLGLKVAAGVSPVLLTTSLQPVSQAPPPPWTQEASTKLETLGESQLRCQDSAARGGRRAIVLRMGKSSHPRTDRGTDPPTASRDIFPRPFPPAVIGWSKDPLKQLTQHTSPFCRVHMAVKPDRREPGDESGSRLSWSRTIINEAVSWSANRGKMTGPV
nr:uncharacterized protein LOC114092764 [Marmota flaviventris]